MLLLTEGSVGTFVHVQGGHRIPSRTEVNPPGDVFHVVVRTVAMHHEFPGHGADRTGGALISPRASRLPASDPTSRPRLDPVPLHPKQISKYII